MAILLIVLALTIAWAAWWWFVTRNRPAVEPLSIANDDPLMMEATRKARETIPRMLELFADAPDSTRVKVPFVTNSGETEHLWAELLEVDGSDIKVRYSTPPVTHKGKLERLHTHPLSDVEDWLVIRDSGEYVGGYTMRVMFIRGREQWGELPAEMQAEEAKYRADD